MKSLVGVATRNPRVVLVVAAILVCVSLYPASQLRLQFDLGELLPGDSPSAVAYARYLKLFGGSRQIFVLVQQPDKPGGHSPALLAQASLRIAGLLESSDEIRYARAGVTEDQRAAYLAGMIQRAPLLIPGQNWMEKVSAKLDPDAIQARVREMRRLLETPWGSAASRLLIFDPLGFSQEVPGLLSVDSSIRLDPLTGTFVSPGFRSALILAEPVGAELDSAAGKRLEGLIEEALETANEELGTNFQTAAVGGPLYASHDERLIRTDLEHSLLITGALCTVLLVAAFGGFAIPLAGAVSLASSLIVVAALTFMISGGVSAVAVGFAAVLVGIGIDIAIHGGTAFRGRKLQGMDNSSALEQAVKDVGVAVAAASLTTAGAFAVLLASTLPPLRELGALVSAGMIVVVIATGTVGCAVGAIVTRKVSAPGRLWTASGRVVSAVVGFSANHASLVLILAIVATMVCLAAALRLDLRPSLEGLRPIDHQVLEAEKELHKLFGVGGESATVLVPGHDIDEALASARSLKRALEELADVNVLSPVDRLIGPEAKSGRLDVLSSLPFQKAHDSLIAELRLAGMRPESFAPGLDALQAFAEARDPVADLLIEDFQVAADDDGVVWVGLLLRAEKDTWPDGPPAHVRSVLSRISPDAQIASVPWVGLELRRVATRDLRRLLGLSAILVGGVVLSSFRGNLKKAILGLAPVSLGMIWTLGIWSQLTGSLDIVELAVLPIFLGIGIDDGLHAVHGMESVGPPRLRHSIERSGRAMLLTTATTGIAFGSLATSHLPALRAISLLVPLGVLSCLVATYSVLPAIESMLRRT